MKEECIIGAVADVRREPCGAARLLERGGELRAREAGDPRRLPERREGRRLTGATLLRQYEQQRR
jgi:hypothetical protein